MKKSAKNKIIGYVIIGILLAVVLGVWVIAPMCNSNKLATAFEKEKIAYTMCSPSSSICNGLEKEMQEDCPEMGKVSLCSYGILAYVKDEDDENDKDFTGMYYWFYNEDNSKAFYKLLTENTSNKAIVRKGKIVIELSTKTLPKQIENVVNRLSGALEKREIQETAD